MRRDACRGGQSEDRRWLSEPQAPAAGAAPTSALGAQWARRIIGKVLVVGVGNPTRGDDAAGLEAAGLVEDMGLCPVLQAEDVPENYLGPMIRAGADTVIFCDAVLLGRKPGAIALLDVDELRGTSISTHNPSLRLLGRCLRAEGVQRVLVAAIEPLHTAWGTGLSPEVRAGVVRLAQTLAEAVGAAQRREGGAQVGSPASSNGPNQPDNA